MRTISLQNAMARLKRYSTSYGYVEAMQNYVALHTEDRKLMAYLTIKGVEEQLPRAFF